MSEMDVLKWMVSTDNKAYYSLGQRSDGIRWAINTIERQEKEIQEKQEFNAVLLKRISRQDSQISELRRLLKNVWSESQNPKNNLTFTEAMFNDLNQRNLAAKWFYGPSYMTEFGGW